MPGQNQLLQALSPALFSALKPHLKSRELATGEVLFAADDKVGHLYFPQSSAVSLVAELSGGQMIETGMVGRDSVIGGSAALDDGEAIYKAIVQVGGRADALDVATARRIARESEEFRTTLFRHGQLILAQAQQAAACNASHHLQERLARWLLRVRDVTGSDSFHLTQEFMAEMLGVGRTSVSIVAHTLQQAGMIHYRRGNVRIADVEALRQAACECYDAVRKQYERLLPTDSVAKSPSHEPHG